MVRFAEEEDLARVNELRKQVNDVHVEGRPDIFKAGFGEELREHIWNMWKKEDRDIIVADRDGVICGFACVVFHERPETPVMLKRRFYDIEEFGVDEAFRRQGIATEIFNFIKADAKKRGFSRIELNMWEFNEGALAFYEEIGLKTYRRYMEYDMESEN